MSNNAQWKMFQPSESHPSPLQDILDLPSSMQAKQAYRNGTYGGEYGGGPHRFSERSEAGCPIGDSPYSGSNAHSQSYSAAPIRETGIIEKLLHSYGFIQCCERQARLFFHFSQFTGNTEHLKIGDPVEFEMTYDRRTGKPIASAVSKIAPEVVLSEARVTGSVTTEVKGGGSGDSTGRISYENRGECFFLPYTKDDVEGRVVLHTGDAVSFQIATNQRGTLGACHVRFENPQSPVKYHGVVCSMKENFGFIERADVVKEIFFHYSEAKGGQELALGDDVEFNIQTRNPGEDDDYANSMTGKEVACNITKLPSGSVVFEDVSEGLVRGQVLKPLERAGAARALQTDPLPGRLRYRALDHSEVEVPFGDKDQCGEFTLRHGDWVEFQVATDRRDHLKRATNITLLDESFTVSGERREQGIVFGLSLEDGFGYIKGVERELSLSFRVCEVLRLGRDIRVGDEVEFTVEPVSTFTMNNRPSVIRIKHLPPGSVQFESLVERDVRGVVSKEAVSTLASALSDDTSTSPRGTPPSYNGLITCQINGNKKSLPYATKPRADGTAPRLGDKVSFDIYQIKRSKELIAKSVKVHQLNGIVTNGFRDGVAREGGTRDVGTRDGGTRDGGTRDGGNRDGGTRDVGVRDRDHRDCGGRAVQKGFVAALKDGFGFIETSEHTKEVFFHFSNFEGNPEQLELGSEVEYTLGRAGGGGGGGGCASAELVRTLPRGSIPLARPLEPLLPGTVTRTLRALNPDQPHYCGLIQTETGVSYEFGIMGLACKREILQVGDPVTFQVDSERRAANIVPVRKKRRATVDAIKGGFGFLSLEMEETRRLFFHMSEVRGAATELQPGDAVEFAMLTNPRNGKSSACNVVKIAKPLPKTRAERPERLLARLRTVSLEEAGPRVVVARAPRVPDGTRGFRPRRPLAEVIASAE